MHFRIIYYNNYTKSEGQDRVYMQKNLTFRGNDVLNIEINYCMSDDKKTNKFCSEVSRAFLNFCEKRLYKSAAENFLLTGQSDEKIFEIFTAKMDFTAEYGDFGKQSNTKVRLDIDINGEKRHKIYSLTNIIVKKKKRKSEEKTFETNYIR